MSFNTIDTNTHHISTIYDEKELSDAVFNSIQYYKNQAAHWKELYTLWRRRGLEQANDELKDEIQSLQDQLKLSYGEFASQAEKDAYEVFEKEHMHDRLISKYNSGRAPYLIPTGAGIGTILYVKCPICGEEKDITDTSGW